MNARITPISSRRAISVALALMCSAVAGFGQRPAPAIPEHPLDPTVYVNPRSPADDPRTGLKGGLYDAASVISGLQLVTTTPKPGTFGPDVDAINKLNAEPPPPAPTPGDAPARGGARGPSYGGTNSDLAFSSKYLFQGNYNGINIYDISDPSKIKLTTSIVCPGGQGDVSVYGHLMFMSVEAANGRLDCGTEGFPTPAGLTEAPAAAGGRPPEPPPSPDRIKGVRIFDISDITKPKQVADVQTCRGSHTHTLLIDPKDKDNVYVYVAGSAPVRPSAELGGCVGGPDDPNTAVFTILFIIIKVPALLTRSRQRS